MSRVLLTAAGATRLREELERLKHAVRPRALADLAEARKRGDPAENSEYPNAAAKLDLVENRIAELEGNLAAAQIVDPRKTDARGRAVFGATVTLREEETGREVAYQIVGEGEADIRAGRLSVHSPLGRALIGARAGDDVTVDAPAGEQRYEVVAVRYE